LGGVMEGDKEDTWCPLYPLKALEEPCADLVLRGVVAEIRAQL
jgi:hypothetical protein